MSDQSKNREPPKVDNEADSDKGSPHDHGIANKLTLRIHQAKITVNARKSLLALPTCRSLESPQVKRSRLLRKLNQRRTRIPVTRSLPAHPTCLRLENPLVTHHSDAANRLDI